MVKIATLIVDQIYKFSKFFLCAKKESQFIGLFPCSRFKLTTNDNFLKYLIPSRLLFLKILRKDLSYSKNKKIIVSPLSFLPFKCSRRILQLSLENKLNECNRRPWIEAAKKISSTEDVPILYCPLFLIDELNFSCLDKVWIPHRNRIDSKISNGIFYMQMVFPFFFTVSESGWGKEFSFDQYSSQYTKGNKFFTVDELRVFVKKNRLTKIRQKENKELFKNDNYDFVYITQLPHDYNVLNNSDYTPLDVMKFLVNFSKSNSLRFLTKIHPLHKNWKEYYKPFLSHVEFTNEGHLHDIFKITSNIVLINSGVGAEALFFSKNIIIFGDTDYDEAVFKSDLTEKNFRNGLANKIDQEKVENYLENYYVKNNILLS